MPLLQEYKTKTQTKTKTQHKTLANPMTTLTSSTGSSVAQTKP
jgi:hypothetical protein